MGRPSNTEERQAQIVGGLLKVMAAQGYERASVVAIAKAAGLAPGLVHYHFGSKQDVLVALVEDLGGRFERRFEQKREAVAGNPYRELLAWIDAALAWGADADPDTVNAWVFVGAEALRIDEVRDVYQANVRRRFEQLKQMLRAALKANSRSTRDVRKIAATILCAVEGAYQLGTAASDVMPTHYAAAMVRHMVRGLMEAQPATN